MKIICAHSVYGYKRNSKIELIGKGTVNNARTDMKFTLRALSVRDAEQFPATSVAHYS